MSDFAQEIAAVNAEMMATQTLLVGVMLGLRNANGGEAIVDMAFEFATSLTTAASYKGIGNEMLDTGAVADIVERLRKAVKGK